MMYSGPRQRADGTGWHYVLGGSHGGGYPIGYCGQHEPHDTELEARACYSQWQRDHVTLNRESSNWMSCEVCGGPTKTGAGVQGDGYRVAALCSEHLTTEHAINALQLNGPAGESWES